MIKGSCVCGGNKFEIERVVALTHCHGSVCRKESGASFTTFAHVRRERFSLVSGEDSINPGYEWTPGMVSVPAGLLDETRRQLAGAQTDLPGASGRDTIASPIDTHRTEASPQVRRRCLEKVGPIPASRRFGDRAEFLPIGLRGSALAVPESAQRTGARLRLCRRVGRVCASKQLV